ncbi:MAG: NAD(P)-dependent oxidoreductase [Pseudomonadota bacterium]
MTHSTHQHIGVLGLGNLGLPCAANLLKAGYTVYGYRRGDMAAFEKLGGIACTSPSDLASRCSVVIELLPGVDGLEECIWGTSGLLAGAKPGLILLNLAGYGAELKLRVQQALAAQGALMVEGAVSGPPEMMAAKKATFFLAGDEDLVNNLQPLVDDLTGSSFYLGSFGAAIKAKLVANLLVAVHNAAAAEALALGTRAGLDGGLLLKILGASAGNSSVLGYKAPRMLAQDYLPAAGSFHSLEKHTLLAKSLGDSTGTQTPLLDTAMALYRHADDLGRREHDIAAVFDWIATFNPKETT